MRVGRVVGGVVLSTALLLSAACEGSSTAGEPGTDTPGTSAGSPSQDPGSASPDSTPVADPEHAVDPPGPRRGSLTYADMLVYNPDSLTDDEVASIADLDGVVSVNSLALANVSIENKVISVAAVDPATYRNFTVRDSAETQAVWDRVAGGELAIDPALGKKLPTDEDGYLRLGSDKDATRVHLGAFAPQVPQVDAVVNRSWIDALEMKDGNALILNTGGRSPQSLRKEIEEIAGKNASVQILGPDLDISVQQTAFLVGSIGEAVGAFNYRVLGGGRIAPEPAWVAAHIAEQQVPILGTIRCNRAIFPQLTAALNEIVSRGLADKIHPGEYAGCYYPRFIAGSTSLSNHSFGLALDLNVPGNLRGTVGEMDRDVVSIFKKWGFAWGGDWRYTDPMHFEANALVNPR